MNYLNEQNYQRSNKGVKLAGAIIICIGLLLIGLGIFKSSSTPDRTESTTSSSLLSDSSLSDIYNSHVSDMYDRQEKAKGGIFILGGVGVVLMGCMVCFVFGNRRKIMAYHMQEMMPLMQEGMQQMRPMVKENIKYMTPVMQDYARQMAPTYGEVAKEVAKGFKEGMNE